MEIQRHQRQKSGVRQQTQTVEGKVGKSEHKKFRLFGRLQTFAFRRDFGLLAGRKHYGTAFGRNGFGLRLHQQPGGRKIVHRRKSQPQNDADFNTAS